MSPKIFFGIVGASIVGLGLYWFFSKTNNRNPPKDDKSENQLVLNLDVQKFSKHFDKEHPSAHQIKQLYRIIVDESKRRSSDLINTFKQQRKLLLNEDFGKYLRYIRDSLIRITNIDLEVKQQILGQLNMSSQHFDNAALRFKESFEETESEFAQGQGEVLSVQQLRKAMNSQKELLEKEGPQIIEKISKEIKTWTSSEREYVEEIINVVFEDQTLKIIPYSSQIIAKSSVIHKHHLVDEIVALRNILTSLLINIEKQPQIGDQNQKYETQVVNQEQIGISKQQPFQKLIDSTHQQ